MECANTRRPPTPHPLFSGTAPCHLSVLESPGGLQQVFPNLDTWLPFPVRASAVHEPSAVTSHWARKLCQAGQSLIDTHEKPLLLLTQDVIRWQAIHWQGKDAVKLRKHYDQCSHLNVIGQCLPKCYLIAWLLSESFMQLRVTNKNRPTRALPSPAYKLFMASFASYLLSFFCEERWKQAESTSSAENLWAEVTPALSAGRKEASVVKNDFYEVEKRLITNIGLWVQTLVFSCNITLFASMYDVMNYTEVGSTIISKEVQSLNVPLLTLKPHFLPDPSSLHVRGSSIK